MQEKTLERCLAGMTAREWYETLNRRIFFWADRKRLVKLLGARAYRDRPHLVLELGTANLLQRHAGDVTLSAINSGATFSMNRTPRGPGAFRRIEDHPPERTVELAVDYAGRDAADLTDRVSRWRGAEELGVVWRRD